MTALTHAEYVLLITQLLIPIFFLTLAWLVKQHERRQALRAARHHRVIFHLTIPTDTPDSALSSSVNYPILWNAPYGQWWATTQNTEEESLSHEQ